MKKFLSTLLSVVIVISLTISSFAVSSHNPDPENVFLDLTTSAGHIEVSYLEHSDGSFTMYEYHNNSLYEITRYSPGNTYFERAFVSSPTRSSSSTNWEVVDFSDTIIETPTTFSTTAKTTKNLGYMHYYNLQMSEMYSIYCYVDEWYNSEKTVTVSGPLGTAAECATWLVGALGLPAVIGTGVVTSLIYAGVITAIGTGLHAAVSTEVTADVTDQRIYGDCTSHSGKPKGDLGPASITYVTSDNSKYKNKYFYEGYTSNQWGTGELGRQMFWKVFGVEYTPTSWTNA